MLEVYRDERNAPDASRVLALKPKLRSWTGRIWRWHPNGFQLMLKLDASVAVSEVKNDELRATLTPCAAELTSFALYLDYTDEGKLPFPWAVGAFYVDREKGAYMRFYDFDAARAGPRSALAGGGRAARPDLKCRALSY